MKYIVTVKEDGMEEIFLFANTINHDTMAESIQGIRNKSWGNWKREYRKPISAGFVDDRGRCYGRSETLDLDSRKEDTQLLKNQY